MLAISNKCAISIEHFAAHPGIVHGRDAEPCARQRRAPEPFANLRVAGRRNLARYEPLRAIDQHPRGRTGSVPQNLAAGWIRRRGTDSTNLQGFAICPNRMPVNTREVHRILRRRGRN